ncbi:MAG: hypothetical protein ABEJ67_06070 [Halanaeroarchaeum sp.]
MAGTNRDAERVTERCPDCTEPTTHRVRVELKTESSEPENAAFSREPYRIAVCTVCGRETHQRMNDA